MRNALLFRLVARIKRLDTKLQAGVYTLDSTMNTDQIIARLLDGQPDGKRFLVHDGYRLEQIANSADAIGLPHFNKQDFLDYTRHPDKFRREHYHFLCHLLILEEMVVLTFLR